MSRPAEEREVTDPSNELRFKVDASVKVVAALRDELSRVHRECEDAIQQAERRHQDELQVCQDSLSRAESEAESLKQVNKALLLEISKMREALAATSELGVSVQDSQS